jgi:hypothetical protein
MAENVMDHIVADLRTSAAQYFPQHGELKNVRIVGHTPKTDHFIYDVVVDFENASERLAAKVYRASKSGQQNARNMARLEQDNLRHVHSLFEKKGLEGVPRPIGDFADHGAIVSEKFVGVPLQSIIMKGALLPGFADNGALAMAATMTGHWLRNFQKCTADMPEPFDGGALMAELEKLCENCKGEGLDDAAIRTILGGARKAVGSAKKTLASAAVLNDFTPLNVVVGEKGISINEFAKMKPRGVALNDAAQFLACIEALEKYPFCNRQITSQVQENFIEAYGVTGAERALLGVLKIRALLGMFAQGRNTGKESAVRKKVMWATVMKRFIQQAAQRTLAPAA